MFCLGTDAHAHISASGLRPFRGHGRIRAAQHLSSHTPAERHPDSTLSPPAFQPERTPGAAQDPLHKPQHSLASEAADRQAPASSAQASPGADLQWQTPRQLLSPETSAAAGADRSRQQQQQAAGSASAVAPPATEASAAAVHQLAATPLQAPASSAATKNKFASLFTPRSSKSAASGIRPDMFSFENFLAAAQVHVFQGRAQGRKLLCTSMDHELSSCACSIHVFSASICFLMQADKLKHVCNTSRPQPCVQSAAVDATFSKCDQD